MIETERFKNSKKKGEKEACNRIRISAVAVLFCSYKWSIDQLEGTAGPAGRLIVRSHVQLGKICEYERGNRVSLLEEIRDVFSVTSSPIVSRLFSSVSGIPRVVQTQGTAGEESGEYEEDDDERGYDGRAGK